MRRTILHTGSSSGIGLESIKHLSEDFNIISLSRREPPFTHPNLTHYEMDFSKSNEKKLKEILKRHGEISALVLCHGMGHFAPLENLSYPQINEVMQINFMSYVEIIKTFLPHLKRQKVTRIISIGSSSAIKGGKEGSIYCASKFALKGFIESLEEECGKSGVHFTQIHPGMVRTPFFDDHHFGPGDSCFDAIEPADIAPIIENALNARPGTILSDIRIKALHRVVKKN